MLREGIDSIRCIMNVMFPFRTGGSFWFLDLSLSLNFLFLLLRDSKETIRVEERVAGLHRIRACKWPLMNASVHSRAGLLHRCVGQRSQCTGYSVRHCGTKKMRSDG